MSNETTPKCPQCGTPLPADAPKGLCSQCLMALNLKTETLFTYDSPVAQPPLPPEQIAPHFPQLEILECLGRGGMGVVYKARQKSLNRFVALKLLAPERVNDTKFAERFTREAQALALLSHPNIVTIHDFGQAGGFYYLLMEFVDGMNLRQLLRARKFTPEEALTIVPPLCDALQFAHDRGIVHRDIKPENLLLDKTGRIKVADFGIAKMLGTVAGNAGEPVSPENATQSAIGTPTYSAPEQMSDPQRVDSRADIYSLGVVFYELLTGELPGKKIEAPSKKVQIDVRLDEIVLRALEKKPELRYQQVSEVKTLVETIVATPGSANISPAHVPPHAPTLLKVSSCYYTTPEYAQSFAGRFLYIYSGKGELRLDEANLTFTSEWFSVVIPLRNIQNLRIGSFSRLAKPARLDHLVVEYQSNNRSEKILLTPALSPLVTTWSTNARVAEWLVAIHQAAAKADSRRGEAQGGKTETQPNFSRTATNQPSWMEARAQPWLRLLVPITLAIFFFAFRRQLLTLHPVILLFVLGLGSGLLAVLYFRKKKNTANPPPSQTGAQKAESPPPLSKPDRFWRWFAMVVLALISFPIVVAILGLLAAVAIPNFIKAREMEQANMVLKTLRWEELFWQMAPLLIFWVFFILIPGVIAFVIWRAMKKMRPIAPPPLPKPDRFWRWFAVIVLALFSIPIVIAILGLLAAIAIPNFIKDREMAQANAQHAIPKLPSAATGERVVKTPPFVARVNQDEVELMAVGNMPWTNPVCWLPNGQPSTEPFPTGTGSINQWSEIMDVKKLAFRIHSRLPDQTSAPVFRCGPESGVSAASSVETNPDRLTHNGYLGQVIVCPKGAAAINVSLGLANGAWKTAATLGHQNDLRSLSGAEGNGEWSATWSAVIGSNGEAAINCGYAISTNWETRMVALDDTGKLTVIPKNSSSVSTLSTSGLLLISTNEFAHIKEFQLQRRKYQWVEFHNVSLQSGHRTTVTTPRSGGLVSAAIQHKSRAS